ncbi:MAG: hypothetical protein HZB67_01365 [Candidatus Aenigmarchaeota archaeon]|nr:hypothetical protein [Candidatus Aenigmarchaeota archaeon]
MHPAAKLIIGLIIAIAGLYWYLAGYIPGNPAPEIFGGAAINALKTVFIGIFGLFLLFVGLIIAWIEYEDLKWEMKEKKTAREKPAVKKK